MGTRWNAVKEDPGRIGALLVIGVFLAIAFGLTLFTFAGAARFAFFDSGWFQSEAEAAATQPHRPTPGADTSGSEM